MAQEIRDVRLGNKIQILRTLRILEKGEISRKDIKALKGEIAAALDAGEYEALIIRKELLPGYGMDEHLSKNLKKGLIGDEKRCCEHCKTLNRCQLNAKNKEL